MFANPNARAALLALFASAVLSFIDNFVFSVSKEAGIWQFQVVRTLLAIPLLLVIGMMASHSLRVVNWGKLALRSLTVSTGLLIYFAALGVLPVAQAAAGLFSAPIWVLLFSALLFSARITRVQLMAIFAGFAGVLMLLQPDLQALSKLSLLPLTAGVFYGLGMLLTPHTCAKESPITLTIGIFLTIGLISLVLLIYFTVFPSENQTFLTRGWVAPTGRFLWLTLFQAVGAVIAVSCISQAYRIGTPSYVAVIEYSFLIFASLWAYLLWGTSTNTLSVVGIALILISGVALSRRQ
ncbi:MAG: DMT family transporter [Marinosulfonomonas sp.]|nr:DMT family transporter [Marinosulfonomonas sp.]